MLKINKSNIFQECNPKSCENNETTNLYLKNLNILKFSLLHIINNVIISRIFDF